MRESLQFETERLARSWERHDQSLLRDYLVADVEDPRLNVQSLITRHFLISRVAPGSFSELMDAELRFAVVMNWFLALAKAGLSPDDWAAIGHGLRQGASNAEGWEIPAYILALSRRLPERLSDVEVPDYFERVLPRAAAGADSTALLAETAGLFVDLWRQVLDRWPAPASRPRVLEVACGSANDYRFFAACGLPRLMDYTGLDLCQKNVDNARAMFPGARFERGNVFAIQSPDRAWNCLLAHDLFEHLSVEGLEAALQEVCRVTADSLVLSFFNMEEVPDHVIRPVEDYHWNTLAVARVRARLAAEGFEGRVVNIGAFLRWAVPGAPTHNPNAYTFLMDRHG